MQRQISNVRSGFSTTEMYSLLFVIFVPIAILIPVFGRAKENDRRSSCQTNMKQVAFGFKLYVQDSNKKLPLTNNRRTSTGEGGWAVLLQPYLKNAKGFQCPSNKNIYPTAPTAKGYTDYWMNANAAGQKEATFASATNTFLMGDTDVSNFGRADHSVTYGGYINGDKSKTTRYGSQITNWYIALGPGASESQQDASSAKHLGGANYVFVDGHVKWMKNDKPSNDTGAALTDSSFSFRVK